MKKIIVSSVLACTLVGSSFLSTAVASEETDLLQKLHVVEGRGAQKDLALDQPINRSEFMKVIVEAVVENTPDPVVYNNCFNDVTNEWFAKYVCFARSQNYIQGYPDGNFHGGNFVTEAEALKIVSEVFSLGAEKYAIPSEKYWYIPYYKNAVLLNLSEANDLVGEEAFAKPATRGRVFGYIAKALALSESTETSYDPVLLQQFQQKMLGTGQLRVLSEEENNFLTVLKTTAAYGSQPQIQTGSLMIQADGLDNGNDTLLGAQISYVDKVTGTQASLDKEEVTMNALLRYEGYIPDATSDSGQMEKTQVVLRVGVSSVIDLSKGFYIRLDDFKIVEVKGGVMFRAGLYEIEKEAQKFKGLWYGMPVNFTEDDLKILKNSGVPASMVRMLEIMMKRSPEPLFSILQDVSGDDVEFSIKISPEGFMTIVRGIEESFAPQNTTTNTYAVRNNMKKDMAIIENILNNLEVSMRSKVSDMKMYGAGISLLKTNLISGTEESVNLTMDSSFNAAFPAEVVIVTPTDTLSLESLFQAIMGGGTMVNAHDVMKFVQNVGMYGIAGAPATTLSYMDVIKKYTEVK